LATVGLRTDKRLHRQPNLAPRPRAARRILAAVACIAIATCGCSSLSGTWGTPSAQAVAGGEAPAYAPPVVTVPPVSNAAPPVAVAQPSVVLRPDLRPPPGVQLSPGVVVAPLNANVIMVAGVYSPERELMPFQPIEWSLAPGSAGQIVTVGDAPNSSLRALISQRPTTLEPNSAIGQTFGDNLVITRGTASARDDLTILRGQTWIGLTSAVEGDCVVTAMSPAIDNPSTRQQTAVIHWVDVLWKAPPSAAALPGTRTALTTRVLRKTSGAPLSGWLVRYTISGGPPAGFAPNGAAQVEVMTDAQGQATAEVVQPAPAAGVNPITIQLVRPAIAGCERLDIGTGTTLLTWTTSAPPVTAIPVPVAPVQPAPIGAPMPTITAPPITAPPIATLPVSPPAVAPPIVVPQPTVTPQPTGPPSTVPPSPVAKPNIELQLTGPVQTVVGGQVTFDLVLINRGDAAATGLVLTDRFDDGLVHAAAANPIQKGLNPIGPHEARRLAIVFKVVKSGRLCNLIELTGDGGLNSSAQACVQSEAAQLTPNPITPTPVKPTPITPTPNPPTPTPNHAAANLKLLIASRANPIKAGGESSYQIVVTNQGTDPEPKVVLSVTIPSVMQFVGAQDKSPSPATIDGQTVHFDPIKLLQPNESLVFEIRVRADKAGKAIVRAEVTSENQAKPQSVDTTTSIFAEP